MGKEPNVKAIFEAFGKVGGVYHLVGMILLNAIVVFSFFHHSPDSPHATGLFDIAFFIAFLLFVFVIVLFTLTFNKASSESFVMLVALVEVFFIGIQLFFITRYEIYGLHSPNGNTTHDKWDALYFSIITWTTTGYGDLVPFETSRWFACSEALLGTLFNGIVLASVIYHLTLMAKPKD
jgi:hypothetical protein